jgi:glycerol kinase
MQFQADILDIPVIRPVVAETTALGSAYAAGLSSGFWADKEELAAQWKEERRWTPEMAESVRKEKIYYWHKAVERTLNWVD